MEYKIELDNGLKIILNEEQIMKVHQYFEEAMPVRVCRKQ